MKNYNEANEGDISPMAQLHNDSGKFHHEKNKLRK